MRVVTSIFLLCILLAIPAKKVPYGEDSDDGTTNCNKCDFQSVITSAIWDMIGITSPQMMSMKTDESISIMTWNILAPMWVDIDALKSEEVVDLNLLNKNIRLRLIVQQILESKADIIALQEVQRNVYRNIIGYINSVYEPVAFAPNKKHYWKSYLPNGTKYAKNGVAMFYKKSMFELAHFEKFETSEIGSFGLSAVLYPASMKAGLKNRVNPIIVLTFHLETGFTVAESTTRVAQGTAVMKEADRLLKKVSHSCPGTRPVVILTGDINSQKPFPGFTNFITRNYLDVAEEIDGQSRSTYIYPGPVDFPTGPTNSSALDHVFIRASDKQRIRLLSAEIPEIRSEKLSEDYYTERVTSLMFRELRRKKESKLSRLMECEIFPILVRMTADDSSHDENVNRVLRLGSDHLPLTVRLQITH